MKFSTLMSPRIFGISWRFTHLWSLTLFVLLGFLVASCDKDDSFYEELAFHYAPVHYQDTDDTNYPADFISRVNYDGNWTTTDNWDNLDGGDLSAWVYYSVVESCTHWFIVYAFYHPRDWDDDHDKEHENDMEGILTIVQKDGSTFGELVGIITVFHLDFFSYIPLGSPLVAGNEDIDGILSWDIVDGIPRIKTIQEAKGHGLKAWSFAGDFHGADYEDGIIYVPSSSTSMVPESGNDRRVSYQLIDLNAFGNLWTLQIFEAQRERDESSTFATWGTLKGDKGGGCGEGRPCTSDAANAPWGWDDEDDGPTFAGEMALDPAHLVDHYFDGLGDFSHQYLRNDYLENLQELEYGPDFLPRGWPDELDLAELYSKLTTTCP